MIREVSQREFTQHNGEFEDELHTFNPDSPCGIALATSEGERLCREGNVEAFQVWSLVTVEG